MSPALFNLLAMAGGEYFLRATTAMLFFLSQSKVFCKRKILLTKHCYLILSTTNWLLWAAKAEMLCVQNFQTLLKWPHGTLLLKLKQLFIAAKIHYWDSQSPGRLLPPTVPGAAGWPLHRVLPSRKCP